jgi:hypothetical protein
MQIISLSKKKQMDGRWLMVDGRCKRAESISAALFSSSHHSSSNILSACSKVAKIKWGTLAYF